MIEVEIDVSDNYAKIGEMLRFVFNRQFNGRIGYEGTKFLISRFLFSNLRDATFFKMRWG